MSGLAKLPLCGKCDNGWLYDETGDEPIVDQCPCRRAQPSGEQRRDAGLSDTAAGNPEAFKAALRIIRDTALRMPVLSSNDCRHEMRIAQVPGPVVGAAFQQAAKDRVLRRIGYVTSTDPGTHAHPVVEWESRLYRKAAEAS